jgi:hypothetical protein
MEPLENQNNNDRDTPSFIMPNYHVRKLPLRWIICSDLWTKVEEPILAVLTSRTHLEQLKELSVRKAALALRKNGGELLRACFDSEAFVKDRYRRYAFNLMFVKTAPPIVKFHVNTEQVTFDAKLRFRMYSQLEEGAKVQTLFCKQIMKGESRNQFRVSLEVLPTQPNSMAFFAGDNTKAAAWYISFAFMSVEAKVQVPPQVGEWLFIVAAFRDGGIEIGCGWEGGSLVKSQEPLGKETFRCDGYIGCEVEARKPYNQMLCDIAYLRVWKVYKGLSQLFEEYGGRDVQHPLLIAGALQEI